MEGRQSPLTAWRNRSPSPISSDNADLTFYLNNDEQFAKYPSYLRFFYSRMGTKRRKGKRSFRFSHRTKSSNEGLNHTDIIDSSSDDDSAFKDELEQSFTNFNQAANNSSWPRQSTPRKVRPGMTQSATCSRETMSETSILRSSHQLENVPDFSAETNECSTTSGQFAMLTGQKECECNRLVCICHTFDTSTSGSKTTIQSSSRSSLNGCFKCNALSCCCP